MFWLNAFFENTATHPIYKTKRPSLCYSRRNCFAQNGPHNSKKMVDVYCFSSENMTNINVHKIRVDSDNKR